MIPTIFITIGSVLEVKKYVKAYKFNKFRLDRIGRFMAIGIIKHMNLLCRLRKRK